MKSSTNFTAEVLNLTKTNKVEDFTTVQQLALSLLSLDWNLVWQVCTCILVLSLCTIQGLIDDDDICFQNIVEQLMHSMASRSQLILDKLEIGHSIKEDLNKAVLLVSSAYNFRPTSFR